MNSSDTPSTPTSPPPSSHHPVASTTSSPPPATTPHQAAQERQEWAELAAQIAGPDPVVETYLQKVGRHNMARLQAWEILRAGEPNPDDPTDTDCPLPPDLPADPTHPLRTDAAQMSDHEYQAALAQWQTTEEYQAPLRQYQDWQRQRSS